MKNLIVLLAMLATLMVFNGCQKDEPVINSNKNEITFTTNSLSIPQQDAIIDNLAKVLSIAINETDIRIFLHNEISKQFTNDYDILYSLIKNNVIELKGNGKITFEDFLIKVANENNLDITSFLEGAPQFKNLQISSPGYFENWKYETYKPVVISLPVMYNTEEKVEVNGYLADGSLKRILEDNINEPILLVRQAERVDCDGLMRVDFNGFVIPGDERLITAEDAYNDVTLGYLKSAIVVEPIINIIDDSKFNGIISKYDINNNLSNKKLELELVARKFNEFNKNTLLKSAQSTLPIPKVKGVFPDEPYSIRIGWEGVTGATHYEIYRQHSSYPVEKIATLTNIDFTFLDNYRIAGQSYYYAIRAIDINGNPSPMSEPYEAIASWRKNGNRDIIEKIFISKNCWNWCCGLFDGKIELQYKAVYYDNILKAAISIPSGSSNMNDLGQKTKSQQKDKLCNYNSSLFPWSIDRYSYDYSLNLIEDDGDGTGTKVIIERAFKIAIKIIELTSNIKLEFNIGNSDKNLGSVIVNYSDTPSYTYSFNPQKGSAYMVLKQ